MVFRTVRVKSFIVATGTKGTTGVWRNAAMESLLSMEVSIGFFVWRLKYRSPLRILSQSFLRLCRAVSIRPPGESRDYRSHTAGLGIKSILGHGAIF